MIMIKLIGLKTYKKYFSKNQLKHHLVILIDRIFFWPQNSRATDFFYLLWNSFTRIDAPSTMVSLPKCVEVLIFQRESP